jgi:hypothetical protein
MYLVPVSMPDAQAQRIARTAVARRVAEPLRGLVRMLIGTPALAVTSRPLSAFTSVPAASVPTADGIAGEDGEVVAFAAMTPPRPGPVHEWVTRAASAAFAAELDLPVVDAFARSGLSAPEALATLPGAERLSRVKGGFRLADWVVVRCEPPRLTTSGLGRFGLPELNLDQVPADLVPSWTIALTGLAARLLELLRRELRHGGETAFVQVPGRIEISRADVASAYGVQLHEGGDPMPVLLSLDPATTDADETYLTVDGPDGQPPAEHRYAVRTTLFAEPVSDAGPAAPRSQPAVAARTRAAAPPAQRTG